MSPRTAEQFENIRQKKKRIIMDAALKVISEKGYHGTSIASIAKESGVSKGLMYNYFSSKEELLVGIMKDGYSRIFEKFVINEKLTPEENVMQLISLTFDVMDEMINNNGQIIEKIKLQIKQKDIPCPLRSCSNPNCSVRIRSTIPVC